MFSASFFTGVYFTFTEPKVQLKLSPFLFLLNISNNNEQENFNLGGSALSTFDLYLKTEDRISRAHVEV